MGSLTSPKIGSASHLTPHAPRICLWCGLRAYPRTTTAWAELPSCVTPSLTAPTQGPPHPQQMIPEGTTTRLVRLVSVGLALARNGGYGNINPLSIDYASRPRLRPRLTLGGLACPRNPWSSGGGVSHPAFATHACILTRTHSTTRSRGGFTVGAALPYPPHPLNQPQPPVEQALPGRRLGCAPQRDAVECHGFGGVLKPRYIVGAEPLDQ